jgi:hypothetical protein
MGGCVHPPPPEYIIVSSPKPLNECELNLVAQISIDFNPIHVILCLPLLHMKLTPIFYHRNIDIFFF